MITLNDFLDVINNDKTTGDSFLYECYGPNAYSMEYWNGKHDDGGTSMSVVFDLRTQVVYEMEAWDYDNQREYRWVHPDYKKALFDETSSRGHDPEDSVDGRKYIDLDVEADILEKASAMYEGVPYDTRVLMEIDFDDDLLLSAMKLAHEQDITFNQYVENALRRMLEELEEKQ